MQKFLLQVHLLLFHARDMVLGQEREQGRELASNRDGDVMFVARGNRS